MVLLSENETNKRNSKAEDMRHCVLVCVHVCVCVCDQRARVLCIGVSELISVSNHLRAWTGKPVPSRGRGGPTFICRKGNKCGDTSILMCLLVHLVVCVCVCVSGSIWIKCLWLCCVSLSLLWYFCSEDGGSALSMCMCVFSTPCDSF